MGAGKSLLDITVEDLCRMFDQVVDDRPDTKVALKAFRLMITDPARAREIIAANPDLAALNGLLDLVEDRVPVRAVAEVH